MVALDTSAGAAQVCRGRCLQNVVHGSIHELPPDDPFDTFLLLGNNLGLLGSAADGRLFLQTLARRALPGARLVGTSTDPHKTVDPVHLALHEQNRQLARLPGQLRIRIRYRDLSTPWFDYLLMSPAELDVIAEGTGWRRDSTFTDGASWAAVLLLENDEPPEGASLAAKTQTESR